MRQWEFCHAMCERYHSEAIENALQDFDGMLKADVKDLVDITAKAHKSIRWIKQRPVDIIVGRNSRFEECKYAHTVENEVYRKGILLYER